MKQKLKWKATDNMSQNPVDCFSFFVSSSSSNSSGRQTPEVARYNSSKREAYKKLRGISGFFLNTNAS
jgi:hypothetical protein